MSNGNFTSVYTKEYLLLLAKFSVENLDAEWEKLLSANYSG